MMSKTLRSSARTLFAAGAVAVVSLVDSAAAQPSTDAQRRFARRFEAFAERLAADPSAPPGFALVVIDGGRIVLARAFGTRDLATRAPMTLDTPIYNASVTKSYTGLLAAQLDAAGVLGLNETLRDVWPNATLPAPLDPSRATAAAFLSHNSGVDAGGLVWRSNETGDLSAADVPGHLATYATPTETPFEYSNMGPVVYAAMAETRSGLSWRDAMAQYVFRPLNLQRTFSRLEDFATGEAAHCHTRAGGTWRPTRLKPTAILNAAGGLFTSPRDAATFLQAFTTDGASARGAIAPAVLRRTWARVAAQDREVFGFRRTGYGLGWDLASYGVRQVVSRSGGSVGCRSLIGFVPDSGFGVVVLTVGDTGGNALNFTLMQQAIDYRFADPRADANAEERVASFRTSVAEALRQVDAAAPLVSRTPEPGWAAYVGRYRNARLGSLEVSLGPDGPVARQGPLEMRLSPTAPDAFTAYEANDPADRAPSRFRRDSAGRVDAFLLEDRVFQREAG